MLLGAKIMTMGFLFLLFAHNCYAGGLGALIEVGKSQKRMKKVLAEETKAFKAIKKSIAAGNIKEGQSQDSIQKRYGKPIVVISENGGIEKWAYKPGYASWFDNIKIYLIFDDSKKLKEIQVLNNKY